MRKKTYIFYNETERHSVETTAQSELAAKRKIFRVLKKLGKPRPKLSKRFHKSADGHSEVFG